MYCAPPDIMGSNQTYHGSILGLKDALLILEGIRQDVLPQVKRRLNDAERKLICPGSIYAWNETKLGMKRWTDGKNWSASKVKGPFLIYHEHDTDRNIKPNGLVKQSFSLTTKQSEKLHLIAYYNPQDRMSGILRGEVPSQDPILLKFNLDPSVYRSDFLSNGTREITVLPSQNPMGLNADSCFLPQNNHMAMAGMGHMRHTEIADPRIQPFMMSPPQMQMSHIHPSQSRAQQPNWPVTTRQMSNIDTQFRMASPSYSQFNGANTRPHYYPKEMKPDQATHEKDPHKHHDKYAYVRDLPYTPTCVSRTGGESVPSIFNAPDPRNGIRTLPSLSESIGKLNEPNNVPKNLLGCSKTPEKEGFKLRSLDKTFSV